MDEVTSLLQGVFGVVRCVLAESPASGSASTTGLMQMCA
jgi:hypothetical protein